MKLLAICILQSVTSVAGAMLIAMALGSNSSSLVSYVEAGASVKGLAGVCFMLLSFVVLTYALGHYRPAIFIPINTATTFLATILLGYAIGHDRVTYTTVAGMMLIGSGITLILRAQ